MLKSKHQLVQAKIMQNTFDHETNVKTDLDNELVQEIYTTTRPFEGLENMS